MPHDRKPTDFTRYPMFWLAVSFAVGILAANLANIGLAVSFGACFILALAALFSRKQKFAAYFLLIAFAAAGIASVAAEQMSVAPNRIRTLYDNRTIRSGDPVEVEGVMLGRPEPSVGGEFLELRAEKLRYHGNEMAVTGKVRLFLPQPMGNPDSEFEISNLRSEISDLKYGSRLRIACKLTREDALINPGVIPKKQILDRLGIDAAGSIKSSRLVEKIADESVFLPFAWVYDQRVRLIGAFRSHLSPRASAIMIASLLGDKYFLDKDTGDLFRDGGTFHILVISGTHITFIGGLLILFLRRITRNRWAQFLVTTLVLWAFTLAVGADVPVVRAALTFTIFLFSWVIYRQGRLLNSFGACAFILLAWRPSDLFDPAFLLTFVAVGAIVAMAFPLIENLRQIGAWTPSAVTPFPPAVPDWLRRPCEMLYWNPSAWSIESKRQIWSAKLFKSPYLPRIAVGGLQRTVRFIVEGILVSLIVQVWMLPLSVVYFHRVSVASILLNLWVGVFIAFETFAAVIGAVVSSFSGLLATPFFTLAEIFNWIMLALPRVFTENGIASFRLPAYSGPGQSIYFIFGIPIIILAFSLNRWRPFDLGAGSSLVKRKILIPTFSALAVLIAIVVFHPFSAPRPDGRLHIDFLDVGQGDSALVTFPDGKTLLVDGGGRIKHDTTGDSGEPFEPDFRTIGEAVVSEFLWYRGYSRIDHILATHADADHIQGLGDVAKNFRVGSAAFGRMPLNNPEFVAVSEVLKRRGIPFEIVARGETLKFGDVTVDVFYPPPVDDPNSVSDNDHSVVIRIVYGGRAFLLTGDIERSAERALLDAGTTLRADLIKVPHHGSRTSSTQDFIDAVGARYAVISVGRTSPFGHPHADVIERWKASGVEVMTTGERGTISVSTDGTDLEVATFQQ